MSYQALGGKLKLKGATLGSAPAKSHASVGVKRQREEGSSSAGPASLVAPLAKPAQAASRTLGQGTLISSGTAIMGHQTRFSEEFNVGDAIEVTHPVTGKQEIRVVKMVLSDQSIGINSPFTSDVVSQASYYVLKLPKAAEDPKNLLAQAEKQRDDAETSAFGTYASKGGTQFTYREKKEGSHGGYAIKTTVLDGARSREELLDMRAKKKGDRRC